MDALRQTLWSLEAVAVFCAIAYLLLAARENLWCWLFAGVSSALYVWIFWDVRLLMESLLSVYYVVMAVVGWQQWRSGAAGQGRAIVTLRCSQHVLLLGAMVLLALASGWWLHDNTDAAWPFLDSFTTWASAITTVLVVRKVLENWLYWLLIDSISLYLYLDRGLYLTALLFAAYLLIVVFGYMQWRRQYRRQSAHTAAA
ncbi:MAG: nicotinamide riboside transporter PnuC [Pseudohongiellaceae bacterium]